MLGMRMDGAGDSHIVGHAPAGNRERDDNAAQRAAEAYRLWLKGWSFSRIASSLGYHDESGARKAWLRAKKARLAPPDLADEVQRERERLEIAYAGIADRVEQGDHWSVDRAVAIAERKAKLLGLDAKDDASTATNYTKRVTLHRSTDTKPADASPESEQVA